MATVITDNEIWDESVPALANGDDADEATLNLPTQALANRTAFLNKKIDDTAATLEASTTEQVGVVADRVDQITPSTFLPGQVIYYAGAAVPAGTHIDPITGASIPDWLECVSGATYLRAVYGALFAAIGTTWGAGNGTTTFNTPPLSGEFIRVQNTTSAGIDANRALGSVQTDDLKTHTHALGGYNQSVEFKPETSGHFAPATGTVTNSGEISATGGTETRPHNIALKAIIKT